MDLDRECFRAPADAGTRNWSGLSVVQPHRHANIGFGRAAAFVRVETDPTIAFDVEFSPAMRGMALRLIRAVEMTGDIARGKMSSPRRRDQQVRGILWIGLACGEHR